MESFSYQEIMEDNIDLKEKCPEEGFEEFSFFFFIYKNNIPEFKNLYFDFF